MLERRPDSPALTDGAGDNWVPFSAPLQLSGKAARLSLPAPPRKFYSLVHVQKKLLKPGVWPGLLNMPRVARMNS